MPVAHRHRRGGLNFARVFAIVIGVHVVGGLGVLWLAKTTAGQELAKSYDIKLFEPPKPPDVEKPPEPPKPPPPSEVAKEAPPTQSTMPKIAAAPAPAAAPTIGGSGGPNWAGGKFVGAGLGDGPEGAFHAAVTGLFRRHYSEPPDDFGPAELELSVSGNGTIIGYQLKRSSGNPKNDQAILSAAAQVKGEGVTAPPENRARVVTVRFTPSS